MGERRTYDLVIIGGGIAGATLGRAMALNGAMPAAQSAVLNAVARPEVGKAAGTFNTFRFLGGVSGIAIAGAVFAGTGSFASAGAFSEGFASAIGVSALLSLAGAVVGMGLPERGGVALANAKERA